MFLRTPPPRTSHNPTPVPSIDRYFDSGKTKGEESEGKENNDTGKEKTDNNTARTNKEQTNHNTRFIRPNHNALFGYFVADEFTGSLLPERRANPDQNNADNSFKSDSNQFDNKLKDNIKSENERNSFVGERRFDNGVDRSYCSPRPGDVGSAMGSRNRDVSELEKRNKLHSAKIHELERELRQVQVENRVIKGRLYGPDEPGGYGAPIPEYDDGRDPYSPSRRDDPRDYDDRNPGERKYNLFDDANKTRYVAGGDRSGPLATNDQYNSFHAGKIKDEQGKLYWGMNKIYNPNAMTSYRNEQVPYLMHKAEKERANASAGGLALIRFHQNSFQDVNTALNLLQRSISVSGGVVGLASSKDVMLLHGERGWRISKDPPRPQIPCRYHTVHDAILATRFSSKMKASELFRVEHNNRFRDPTFLLPYGFESTYVPLKEIPRENLDAFLILEVERAKNHTRLQEFEAESRSAMLQIVPGCQPYFGAVTCRTPDMEIVGIKPGVIFRDGSRIFISAFESLVDVAKVWNSGMLMDMLDYYGIRAEVQAFAFSMKDTKDHFSTPHWR